MPDIHPNPESQDGQQENRLVDGVDLSTAHRDSSNGSNGGADTILFRSRNGLLSLLPESKRFIVSTKVCVETSSSRAEYSETDRNF